MASQSQPLFFHLIFRGLYWIPLGFSECREVLVVGQGFILFVILPFSCPNQPPTAISLRPLRQDMYVGKIGKAGEGRLDMGINREG